MNPQRKFRFPVGRYSALGSRSTVRPREMTTSEITTVRRRATDPVSQDTELPDVPGVDAQNPRVLNVSGSQQRSSAINEDDYELIFKDAYGDYFYFNKFDEKGDVLFYKGNWFPHD